MSTKKGAGSAKNLRDSKPKFLGIKLTNGQNARTGEIIVRQRGTRYAPGKNVGLGKDHTIFAKKDGTVKFSSKRHLSFKGKQIQKKTVSVV